MGDLVSEVSRMTWEDEWYLRKDEIIVEIAKSPHQSCRAVKTWPMNIRVSANLNPLMESILTSHEHSCEAATSLHVGGQYQEKMVDKTLESVQYSCFAGERWNDFMFKTYGSRLVDVVSQDSNASYLAGKDWDTERSLPYVDKLVSNLSSEDACKAGENWERELFKAVGWEIIQKVTEKKNQYALAILSWSGWKKDLLKLGKHPNPTNNYFNYNEKQQQIWVGLEREKNVNSNLFIALSQQEFELAARAWELAFASKNIVKYHDAFPVVLEQRTVRQWAQTIIDGFNEKGAIGGDSYDRTA